MLVLLHIVIGIAPRLIEPVRRPCWGSTDPVVMRCASSNVHAGEVRQFDDVAMAFR
jgi:hypothetical protein